MNYLSIVTFFFLNVYSPFSTICYRRESSIANDAFSLFPIGLRVLLIDNDINHVQCLVRLLQDCHYQGFFKILNNNCIEVEFEIDVFIICLN